MRTVKIYGKAYAEIGSVNVVSSVEGTEIYNGPVPTVAGEAPIKNPASNVEELFSFEVPDELGANEGESVSTVVTVTGGTLILVTYGVNKFNPADLDEFVLNWKPNIKTDIVINGEEYTPVHDPDENGTWHLVLEDGDTASITWNLRQLGGDVPGAL